MYSSLWFWAKLGYKTWPEEYHPVICHLIDVAAVTQNLWDAVFRPQFREWLAKRLELDEDSCGRWLAFWSGAHDIGKVAPCFQDRNDQRTNALNKRLQDAGFLFSTWNKPHGTISSAILAELLEAPTDWPRLDRKLAVQVAIAVGGHHGLFPADWIDVRDLLRSTRQPCSWDAARREMLASLARLLGVGVRAPQLPETSDLSIFMVLAGLTSVADWIGSNQAFFRPKGCPAVVQSGLDLDGYFTEAQDRAKQALTALGWLERGKPGAMRSFAELFADILPGEPRPLQRVVAESAQRMTKPTLMVVEAPMGEGKTEAAWYVADVWDQAGGQGTYVALPTMATSNQMFDRVGEFLKANAGKQNLMLLHGKAALNDKFEKLKYAARIYDDEKHPSAVVAEVWFAANKKHGLLAPYGVGTIDQALLAVLQTKHVFVRLFGLAGKCVILDEVHAYDAYMTTLMERQLRWLAALGCPVVLLSATLPRDKRLKLLQAYAGDNLPELEEVPYPRVTSVAVGLPAEVRHIKADPDRARAIELAWIDEGNLAETLRQALANGGCGVVIRNTVGLAQNTYLQLRDALKEDGIDVELFHARFPFGRRRAIEDAVLKRFGKEGGPAQRNKRVLVATQVVEQSLDLDFDVMISDVAPVDLVLQRAGRLHRHARGQRPPGVTKPRMWLIKPDVAENGLPDFGVSGIVYSPHILYRTLLILRSDGTTQRDTVKLPSEIDGLVNGVYDETYPPSYLSLAEQNFWRITLDGHHEAIEKEEAEAESRQIKKPQFRGSLSRVVSAPREEDSPDLHPAHQALTRLTRPTVSLICLLKDFEGTYFLPHDSSPVRTLAIRNMSSGGFKDISRLMLGEITSAHRGLLNELRAVARIPDEWVDLGLLNRHHLIVFTEGKAHVGPYELELDYYLGLTITRANVQGEDE
jgi:CRISPR-associated endonuclease/helicase Cas3